MVGLSPVYGDSGSFDGALPNASHCDKMRHIVTKCVTL
jgi:hypothetical protein